MTDIRTHTERPLELPERFEAGWMQGEMIEAEHFVRYSWAGQFARGARVLDAGCGIAYGSALLAEAGASEVVAVDRDKAVAAPGPALPQNVTVDVGDLTALDYGDDSFDLVVCFEVIEYVAEPELVLDELHRVLRADGLLIVSTPNRDVHTSGQLEAMLARRFRSVALRRQHTWIASGVFDDDQFAADGNDVERVELRKTVSDVPGQETSTVGLASDGELPAAAATVSLTGDLELRRWSEALGAQRKLIDELSGSRAELELLRRQLLESERELDRMTEVEARATELNAVLEWHHTMLGSFSWRLTAPLRRFSGLTRQIKQKLLAQARKEIVAARSRK